MWPFWHRRLFSAKICLVCNWLTFTAFIQSQKHFQCHFKSNIQLSSLSCSCETWQRLNQFLYSTRVPTLFDQWVSLTFPVVQDYWIKIFKLFRVEHNLICNEENYTTSNKALKYTDPFKFSMIVGTSLIFFNQRLLVAYAKCACLPTTFLHSNNRSIT